MKQPLPVTPTQMARFRAQLAAHDIAVPDGNAGEIRPGWGIVLGFSYDGIGSLTVTIEDVGWDSESDIWSRLAKYMTAAGVQIPQ